MELFTARYISFRQPSADNSSSLGSKLISSNAPTYDFYLRELLRSELTFTYLLTAERTCLSGSADWDTVRTDRDGLSEKSGFNSPDRPLDFVFGFQGRMFWD